MPTTWIIDDGPLDHLSAILDLEALASWPRDRFVIADATAQAARGLRGKLLKDYPSTFSKFEVILGTRAFEILYDHLRSKPNQTDKNLAEHESIAWALAERPDAVLVAQDKGAAFLALAELGCGGAAHPTELWLHLRAEGLISQQQFEQLCSRTMRSDQSQIPLRCKAAAQ